MDLEYDEVKNAANIEKHGFSLNAFAPLDGRLCTAVFTRRGRVHRVISLRKSNKRERDV